MAQADISLKLEQLRADYWVHVQGTLKLLENYLGLIRQGSLHETQIEVLHSEAHKLAGSAGSYGFDEIGHAARKLEQRTNAKTGIAEDIEIMASLAMLIDTIKQPQTPQQALPADLKDIAAPVEQPRLQEKATVLIADDDPVVLSLLESLMSGEVNVELVSHGEGVIDAIDRVRPALILLDNDLPGLTGVQIIEKLQKEPELREIPVIMLTGNHDPRNVMQAVTAGAVDYFTKPFEPVSFVSHLRGMLHRMKHSVMIIDDDETIHELLTARFEMLGINVFTALDGIQALDMLDTRTPSLILLDRMMPGMEGAAVLHEIKQREPLKDIPVIMLTARSNASDAHDWLRRGAVEFMTKPFNTDEVILRAMRAMDLEEAGS